MDNDAWIQDPQPRDLAAILGLEAAAGEDRSWLREDGKREAVPDGDQDYRSAVDAGRAAGGAVFQLCNPEYRVIDADEEATASDRFFDALYVQAKEGAVVGGAATGVAGALAMGGLAADHHGMLVTVPVAAATGLMGAAGGGAMLGGIGGALIGAGRHAVGVAAGAAAGASAAAVTAGSNLATEGRRYVQDVAATARSELLYRRYGDTVGHEQAQALLGGSDDIDLAYPHGAADEMRYVNGIAPDVAQEYQDWLTDPEPPAIVTADTERRYLPFGEYPFDERVEDGTYELAIDAEGCRCILRGAADQDRIDQALYDDLV